MIEYAIATIRLFMQTDWKRGIDELLYTTRGSNIQLPDKTYDWQATILEEIFVGQWVIAKLNTQSREERKEQESQRMSKSQANLLNVPILDKFIELGIYEILVHVKAIDLQSQSVLTEYNDSNTMTVNYIWFPVECLTPCLLQIPPKSYSFLPES